MCWMLHLPNAAARTATSFIHLAHGRGYDCIVCDGHLPKHDTTSGRVRRRPGRLTHAEVSRLPTITVRPDLCLSRSPEDPSLVQFLRAPRARLQGDILSSSLSLLSALNRGGRSCRTPGMPIHAQHAVSVGLSVLYRTSGRPPRRLSGITPTLAKPPRQDTSIQV